jgi:hypothetical protein
MVVQRRTKGPRLSAKQKKMLKKGKPSETATPTSTEQTDLSETGAGADRHDDGDQHQQQKSSTTDSREVASTEGASSSNPISKNVPLPRGKRSKVKKMKKMYQDQDEEERQLKLSLLGVSVHLSICA